MVKLNAQQLRTQEPDLKLVKNLKKNPVYLILDNVLDTYNIGSIFRLADAVAAEKIFLCGQTETPPNPRIKKASINTWKWVNWQYVPTAVEAIANLKSSRLSGIPQAAGQISNLKTVVVEQHPKSISLYDFKPEFPVVLVVGNETYGVAKEVLDLADTIVEIPMWGINKSLNVMVSCAIVLFKMAEFFRIDLHPKIR